MMNQDLAAALLRLRQNPDFQLFEKHLHSTLEKHKTQLESTDDIPRLPVFQGRVQSLSAIIEEMNNVNRKPRS